VMLRQGLNEDEGFVFYQVPDVCKRPILLGTMQYMAPELLTLLP